MEPLAVFEYIESEGDLDAVALLLDPQQRPLQVQPEADLLQSGARCGISV